MVKMINREVLRNECGLADGMGYGIEANTYEEAYAMAREQWNIDKPELTEIMIREREFLLNNYLFEDWE